MTSSTGDTADAARSSASRVQQSAPFQAAARTGFAVNGLLHLVIGGIALKVAFGAGGSADQSGALGRIASEPFGLVVLWVVAVGLWALGAFYLLDGALVRGTDSDAWGERAKAFGKGVAYVVIGFTAATFASGGSSDSSHQSRSVSAKLLATPGGVILLVVVGLAVIAIGGYLAVKGIRRTFLEDIRRPPAGLGRATELVGTIGYAAKGVAIAVVGILFVTAAFTSDASKARGLDGAVQTLADLPFGKVILTAVALGLIAFGVYGFVRARYGRL
jgi:Domain of Unknown Function (DUF1206)